MSELKVDSEEQITATDRLNEFRWMVDKCHGLRGQDGSFCENFGCDQIIELLEMIAALEAELAKSQARVEEIEKQVESLRDYADDTLLYTPPAGRWDSIKLISEMADRALTTTGDYSNE